MDVGHEAELQKLRLILAEKEIEIESLQKELEDGGNLTVIESSDVIIKSVKANPQVLRSGRKVTPAERAESQSFSELAILRDQVAALQGDNRVIQGEHKTEVEKLTLVLSQRDKEIECLQKKIDAFGNESSNVVIKSFQEKNQEFRSGQSVTSINTAESS